MKTYAKGFRAEREILHFLNNKGLSCVRQASSGGHLSPVDIVAIKNGLILGLECKNHARKPRLAKDQMERFSSWCKNAGAIGFLAWRNSGKWLFLKICDAEAGNYEDNRWIEMEDLLSAFGIE